MGTLACILKEMGFGVSGSDMNVYPPMSDFLAQKGITLFEGYRPSNIDHNPELVIIGNVITRQNQEARAVLDRNIHYLSMPQAVNRFIAGNKRIILVTGTHGKTTTASIMAHILHTAGMDPSFMIGGILKDFNSSFRIGTGEYMVIEGDEYDTAFFDKGPKFMHYDPEIVMITGIEFDHADIFRDVDHIKDIFLQLIRKNEKTAHFITYKQNSSLDQVLNQADITSHERYGIDADWSCTRHDIRQGKTFFELRHHGESFRLETKMAGKHNLNNITACAAAACKAGIDSRHIFNAVKSFSGVKRRQEVRGVKNNITVMDDFAHHPTAVRETIKALKPFYPEGRLIAVFEPRTNTSMRKFFQDTYPDAFTQADMVCICRPGVNKNIPEIEKFSIPQLVEDIKSRKIDAHGFENADQVIEFLVPVLKPGDLVLIMSNGGFDNIHERLLERIQ